MSAEVEVEGTVETEAALVHDPTNPDQYASAAERAKHVHIRDIETEPRWNGHAPTETRHNGTQMVVCMDCGAMAWTRPEMADQRRCPE